MQLVPESLTFVIAGKWNKYILTLDWVAKNIFTEDQINVEFSMEPDLPFRYHKGFIRFIPTNSNVTFQALNTEKQTLDDIQKKSKDLISLLDKTPIMAFGVNVSYKEDSPSPDLLNLFNLSDNLDEEYSILKSDIMRTIRINDRTVLNLSLSLMENTDVIMKCNFHTETKTVKEYLEYFEENEDVFYKYYNKSKEILKNAYNLIVQEEDAGNEM